MNFVFERRRIPYLVLAFVIIDKVCHEVGILLEHLFGTFQSHHHKGSGKGIGSGTVVGEYGGRKDVMLYGASRLGVDGMGIALSPPYSRSSGSFHW